MKTYVGFKALDMGFDAHLTVCYFGPDATEKDLSEIQNILDAPMWSEPIWVVRKDIALFGPDNDVPVLRVTTPAILGALHMELADYSVSEYTWNPHITLDIDGADDIHIPVAIKLDHLGIY